MLTLLLAGMLTVALSGVILSGLAAATDDNTNSTTTIPSGAEFMMGGGREGGRGNRGCFDGRMGEVEVSAEYTQKVNDILNSDADVMNLLAKGYNVTGIRPNIKMSIAGDGSVTQTASTVSVALTDGETGFARVYVDVSAGKVLRIETVTRTVIDKSTN